jgi:hypothetical protein
LPVYYEETLKIKKKRNSADTGYPSFSRTNTSPSAGPPCSLRYASRASFRPSSRKTVQKPPYFGGFYAVTVLPVVAYPDNVPLDVLPVEVPHLSLTHSGKEAKKDGKPLWGIT